MLKNHIVACIFTEKKEERDKTILEIHRKGVWDRAAILRKAETLPVENPGTCALYAGCFTIGALISSLVEFPGSSFKSYLLSGEWILIAYAMVLLVCAFAIALTVIRVSWTLWEWAARRRLLRKFETSKLAQKKLEEETVLHFEDLMINEANNAVRRYRRELEVPLSEMQSMEIEKVGAPIIRRFLEEPVLDLKATGDAVYLTSKGCEEEVIPFESPRNGCEFFVFMQKLLDHVYHSAKVWTPGSAIRFHVDDSPECHIVIERHNGGEKA